jgi:hypothetical protein
MWETLSLNHFDIYSHSWSLCPPSAHLPHRVAYYQHPGFKHDALVRIVDVRMMQPLPPVAFAAGAVRVRFVPKYGAAQIVALSGAVPGRLAGGWGMEERERRMGPPQSWPSNTLFASISNHQVTFHRTRTAKPVSGSSSSDII